MDYTKLEQEIGYTFQDKNLLQTALTHTSYAYERKTISNEKLEFLGDSILEFLSSIYIYQNYPKLKEGEMTKVRAQVVCEASLYKVAKSHNFSDFLRLGKSERVAHKQVKPAIMADSVEAVIAAMYLDGGLEPANKFIVGNLKEEIKLASQNVGQKDYKTVLQEILQQHGDVHIEYKIIKEVGPDHDKIFVSEVIYNGKILATGEGKSKKHAEMEAAKHAIELIKKGWNYEKTVYNSNICTTLRMSKWLCILQPKINKWASKASNKGRCKKYNRRTPKIYKKRF